MPLGVVAGPDAPAGLPEPGLPTANPLLALRARGTLLTERASNAVGTLLRPLFRWPVIVAVVASVLAVDYWLFAVHGLGGGIQQVLHDPVDFLVVIGLSLASAAFHECGHAAGCRYGGARPGVIGVGIYVMWPAFFTNVTDSYRLNRAGRLRTDLGGLYFNLIFMLALAAVYSATSSEILLLVIAVTHLEMLEQLLPFVRFDGYFILSDLVGVPDLFARIVPILRSAADWAATVNRPTRRGRPDPRVAGLRRHARIVVTGWVMCVLPLLLAGFGYMLLRLPAIDRSLWHAASVQAHLMTAAVGGHRYATAAVAAVGAALLGVSLAGLGLCHHRAGPAGGHRRPALVRRPRPPAAGRRGLAGRRDCPRRLLDRQWPAPRLVSHGCGSFGVRLRRPEARAGAAVLNDHARDGLVS